ncbi:MAG: ankyrin repeat domain-containing protein [Burkholderiales bacterium]|nr:ankyrin repeat domain-containing protein [Burkholderiales bacterium]
MIRKLLVLASGILLMCSFVFAESYEDAVSATINNKPEMLAQILAKGFDPNSATPGGSADPLISLAIRNKSNKVIDLLLQQKNLNVNAPNALNETPLMLAVYYLENDTAQKLVEHGADVNNPGHWSPLHYAAAADNTKMVNYLIKKNADINARTLRGFTPLYMAARDGTADTVQALLKAGARKDFCNNDGLAPYDIAKQRQNTDEVLEMLKYDHCR